MSHGGDQYSMAEDNNVLIEQNLDNTEIDVDELRKQFDTEARNRSLWGWQAKLVVILAVSMSVFHLYTAGFGLLLAMKQRAVHLAFVLVLVFLMYPISQKVGSKKGIPWYDFIFAALGAFVTLYMVVNFEALVMRAGLPTRMDLFVGFLGITLLLEATRRVSSPILPCIAIFFLFYCFLGRHFPEMFQHRGFTLSRVINHMYMGTEGVFGIPLAVSATFVFMFILFGSFLEQTGMGKFIIDLSMSLAGHSTGGPAKVAVLSSGFMGSISGSSVANVCTTGMFTIPLMKSVGYKPYFAGAVEAVASTGGQIMPPIMGAAAFIMAEFLGVPYIEVAKAAILPAAFYYLALFMAVDFRAAKIGLVGLSREQLPSLVKTLKIGWILLAPIFILIYLLIDGYSPQKSVVASIVVLLIISMFNAKTRMTPKKIIEAITDAGIAATTVAVACAAAGIIVGITTMSGLGLKFTGIVFNLSRGILPIALLLASISSLVLGMGVPTTANYVIMATLIAPALIRLMAENSPLILPHLFVFYYGILADITPPVMLAVFAGAAIARAHALKVGMESMKLALPGYILPFMFIYHPEIIAWNFMLELNVGKLGFS